MLLLVCKASKCAVLWSQPKHERGREGTGGGEKKGGIGGTREERGGEKRPWKCSSFFADSNIYIVLSSSCLCHFHSYPFIQFPPSSQPPQLPLLTIYSIRWRFVAASCMGPAAWFFSPLQALSPPPPASLHPEVEHTCRHSIHTNTQLCCLLFGTFQGRTLQTFSTACRNVDVKRRSCTPAMLINRKQALFKVGVLAMKPGEEIRNLLSGKYRFSADARWQYWLSNRNIPKTGQVTRIIQFEWDPHKSGELRAMGWSQENKLLWLSMKEFINMESWEFFL